MLDVAQLRMKSEKNGVRSAFRKSNPDSLGFTKTVDFKSQLEKEFALSPEESSLLCSQFSCLKNDDNIHFKQIFSILDPVDKYLEVQCIQFRNRSHTLYSHH